MPKSASLVGGWGERRSRGSAGGTGSLKLVVQDPGRALQPTFPPGLGDVTASLVCRCWSSMCISSGARLCRLPGGSRSGQKGGEKEVAGAFQKSPRQGLKGVSHGASWGSTSGGTSPGAQESGRSSRMGGRRERWWSRGGRGAPGCRRAHSAAARQSVGLALPPARAAPRGRRRHTVAVLRRCWARRSRSLQLCRDLGRGMPR